MTGIDPKISAAFKAVLGLAAALAGTGAKAQHDTDAILKPCDEANIGLRDLAISEKSGVRTFYEGNVLMVSIDQVEPAAAARGVAILAMVPGDEPGARRCLAATGFAFLDLARARSRYDPREGLSVIIPASDPDDVSGTVQGPPLVVRINLGSGAMTASR